MRDERQKETEKNKHMVRENRRKEKQSCMPDKKNLYLFQARQFLFLFFF